ncbi:MAG: efflux RND transporter periplasmic adaptor subunit [Flavobacteriales bacterium]|nr:efflux RND transporter periplasmic adaptor subunit [Flavobacteriales bacterium]
MMMLLGSIQYGSRIGRWSPFLIVALSACTEERVTTRPKEGAITESVYASGVVKALDQYVVHSQVNGILLMAYVTEGDTVEAGDPLFLIDDRSSSLASRKAEVNLAFLEKNASSNSPVLAQLRASVTRARESLENDSALYAKQMRLWEKQIGSENDLEQRRLAYTTSRANYEAALEAYAESRDRLRTELSLARSDLELSKVAEDDRTVRSWIDGVVYDVSIEKGELATTQRALAVLGSAEDFLLELNVDEYDIVRIAPGQRVLVTMDSYRGQVMEAIVTKVDPLMDERSRTFSVEAVFLKPPSRLYPNLTAEANIVIRSRQEALLLPANYVTIDDRVILASGDSVALEIGLRDLEMVEVISGIDASTVVVLP